MPGVTLTAAVSLAPGADLGAAAGAVVRRPERMDALCQAGVALAARAIDGVDDLGRHALVLGTALGCLESDAAYYRQLIELGLPRTNPRIFAYTLPNVVLGHVAIALGLTGDNQSYDAGRASGLTALGEAADQIRTETLDSALVLVLDLVGPATAELFGALGTTPRAAMMAFVLQSTTQATRGLARVVGSRASFDPDAEWAAPPVDFLGATGVAPLLAPIAGPRTLVARCPSGHQAELDVAPLP